VQPSRNLLSFFWIAETGSEFMHDSVQPGDQFPSARSENTITGADQSKLKASDAVAARYKRSRTLEETELDSALQLLVERAQYLTGATGAALALPQGEEMVCRASAGSSAPAVGTRLQIFTGLTGESISRRQMLRCDNAETDERVNQEACRALGIASIVVLPLLGSKGEVCGLFELLSDHPQAFEERDLNALERIAGLTLTALNLSEQGQVPVVAPAPAAIPEAMLRVQKCVSCGFPVPEGKTLCLDCDTKNAGQEDASNERRQPEPEQGQIEQQVEQPTEQKAEQQIEQSIEQHIEHPIEQAIEPSIEQLEINPHEPEQGAPSDSAAAAEAPMAEEYVPAFLRDPEPATGSWLADHFNLLALAVLILGIVVAVVAFR
jgi:putative methionine-R-sulfoxide reductase with GAF domain/uncharacterized Zn finger protein (UPF0148 family)